MRKRVLVVDDDEMNLKRTKMILNRDYEVLLAESGKAALDKIRFQKIDLILLDIAMPGMDGMETFERMREFNDDVPVIFLTASGQEEDVLKAIRLGAVNYLKKPFYPQDLLERVAKEFDKK
ncbi:response regulator [Lachnospiraceae bacterium 29-84]